MCRVVVEGYRGNIWSYMDKGYTLLRSIPAGEQLAHGKVQSREQSLEGKSPAEDLGRLVFIVEIRALEGKLLLTVARLFCCWAHENLC